MTEAEWLVCTLPDSMLLFLGGRASARQLRLFACACVRRIWHLLSDARSREVVEVTERHVEGRASRLEWLAVRDTAVSAASALGADAGRAAALATGLDSAWGAAWCAARDARYAAAGAASLARALAGGSPDQASAAGVAARASEGREQAALLRCLCGSVSRPAPVFQPAWLARHDGSVVAVARMIYEERRFDDMPILADILEETGCTDGAVLAHCRSGNKHIRGCWILDVLLGQM